MVGYRGSCKITTSLSEALIHARGIRHAGHIKILDPIDIPGSGRAGWLLPGLISFSRDWNGYGSFERSLDSRHTIVLVNTTVLLQDGKDARLWSLRPRATM